MKLTIPASSILDTLRGRYGATLEPYDGDGDWFKVTGLNGQAEATVIYWTLQRRWREIAGNSWEQCALLRAKTGRYAGVWVHVWPPWEYRFEAGPDEVESLDY